MVCRGGLRAEARRARSNTKDDERARGNSEIRVRHVRDIRIGRAATQGFGGGLGGGGKEVSGRGRGSMDTEVGLVVAAAHGETLQLPRSRSREDCAGIAAALLPKPKEHVASPARPGGAEHHVGLVHAEEGFKRGSNVRRLRGKRAHPQYIIV